MQAKIAICYLFLPLGYSEQETHLFFVQFHIVFGKVHERYAKYLCDIDKSRICYILIEVYAVYEVFFCWRQIIYIPIIIPESNIVKPISTIEIINYLFFIVFIILFNGNFIRIICSRYIKLLDCIATLFHLFDTSTNHFLKGTIRLNVVII